MFTGIIEAVGTVKFISTHGTNRSFSIQSSLAHQFKIDQSVAHNGVCLTVEAHEGDTYQVTAVNETLEKTTLGTWQEGDILNLERSLLPTSRLDGHFVQGHVDTKGVCKTIEDAAGSFLLTFSFPSSFAALVIEKGSICLDGISLTVFNVTMDTFQVAVIPYTWQHTNLQKLQQGAVVNLEFDLLGKYILRKMALSKAL